MPAGLDRSGEWRVARPGTLAAGAGSGPQAGPPVTQRVMGHRSAGADPVWGTATPRAPLPSQLRSVAAPRAERPGPLPSMGLDLLELGADVRRGPVSGAIRPGVPEVPALRDAYLIWLRASIVSSPREHTTSLGHVDNEAARPWTSLRMVNGACRVHEGTAWGNVLAR